ncbi:MAG: hypothetical protein ACOZAO_01560 [Patescibacteria group bacterium]
MKLPKSFQTKKPKHKSNKHAIEDKHVISNAYFEPLEPMKSSGLSTTYKQYLTFGVFILLAIGVLSFFYLNSRSREFSKDSVTIDLVSPDTTPGISKPNPVEVSPIEEIKTNADMLGDDLDKFAIESDLDGFKTDLGLDSPIF